MALGGAEVLRHQMRGEAAELFRCRVGAGEHTKHAGSRLGLGYVDADDAGMGVRGEHDGAMAKAGQTDVVDIASLSEQETLVFHSPHSLSDAELGHFRSLCSRCDGCDGMYWRAAAGASAVAESRSSRWTEAQSGILKAARPSRYTGATAPRSMRKARDNWPAMWTSFDSAIRIESP